MSFGLTQVAPGLVQMTRTSYLELRYCQFMKKQRTVARGRQTRGTGHRCVPEVQEAYLAARAAGSALQQVRFGPALDTE
jgi:hypothetical protein